jgi:hypothetical protein
MTYEIINSPMSGVQIIKRINDDETESFIPFDEANKDYQEYLTNKPQGDSQ